MDFCSSWISHFPPELEEAAVGSKTSENDNIIEGVPATTPGSVVVQKLEVIGFGINDRELAANPILKSYHLQDLNASPEIPASVAPLDASTCVASIDYLTKPVDVLKSVFKHTRSGGKIHLVVSNRCFPTKAVGRWLRVSEEEKLQMVGDYLFWAGWKDIEICTLNDGKTETGAASGIMDWFSARHDPLWVVRGVKS